MKGQIMTTTIPAGKWKIDTTHSEIGFSIKHLMISKVKGKFNSFKGEVITTDNPTDFSVTGTVDVDSIDTNQKDRDQHLRTGDFFEAEKYPTINFVSTKITHVKGDDYKLEGDFTLRGVTKPIVLNVEFGGITQNLYGQTVAAASATGEINREDFGLTYNSALEAGGVLLGDTVKLNLEVQAVLATA
jgi:polyisoprenoid-binding protein YceI